MYKCDFNVKKLLFYYKFVISCIIYISKKNNFKSELVIDTRYANKNKMKIYY